MSETQGNERDEATGDYSRQRTERKPKQKLSDFRQAQEDYPKTCPPDRRRTTKRPTDKNPFSAEQREKITNTESTARKCHAVPMKGAERPKL